MKGKTLLPRTSLRGFQPRTFGGEDIPKKEIVRKGLTEKIPDLSDLRAKCMGKKLWVDVTFFLFNRTTNVKRYEKDLDNMLKIVLDALPEFMDQKRLFKGLGLMPDKGDDLVFELHSEKHFVGTEAEEGIDLEIAEWVE